MLGATQGRTTGTGAIGQALGSHYRSPPIAVRLSYRAGVVARPLPAEPGCGATVRAIHVGPSWVWKKPTKKKKCCLLTTLNLTSDVNTVVSSLLTCTVWDRLSRRGRGRAMRHGMAQPRAPVLLLCGVLASAVLAGDCVEEGWRGGSGQFVLVTGASSNHYVSMKNMIASARETYAGKVVAWDIGLSADEVDDLVLQDLPNVELRTFNFSAFPEHVLPPAALPQDPLLAD